MNINKLRLSNLRGNTAKMAILAINNEFEKFFKEYFNKITNGLITYTPDDKYHPINYSPFPSVSSQSDIIRLVRRQDMHWTKIIFVKDHDNMLFVKGYTEELLLFNDSMHVLIRVTPRIPDIYKGYKSNGITSYDIIFNATIFDKQGFLDSLGIEPNMATPHYVDILNNPIRIGDIVCVTTRDTNRLYIDKVKKLTPYSIILENNHNIPNKDGYDNKIIIINDLSFNH